MHLTGIQNDIFNWNVEKVWAEANWKEVLRSLSFRVSLGTKDGSPSWNHSLQYSSASVHVVQGGIPQQAYT